MINPKKVTFNKNVSVILIPEIKEYSEIKSSIWYNNDDFYYFSEEEYKRKKRIRIHEKYKSDIFRFIT